MVDDWNEFERGGKIPMTAEDVKANLEETARLKREEEQRKHRVSNKVWMREVRKIRPRYAQSKINRTTIAYCPNCNADMPWSEAVGDPAQESLKCPKCDAVLKRLVKTHRAGKTTMRRNTKSFCLKCKTQDYWQQAKRTKRGNHAKDAGKERLVCNKCGGTLYTMTEQTKPRKVGGYHKKAPTPVATGTGVEIPLEAVYPVTRINYTDIANITHQCLDCPMCTRDDDDPRDRTCNHYGKPLGTLTMSDILGCGH